MGVKHLYVALLCIQSEIPMGSSRALTLSHSSYPFLIDCTNPRPVMFPSCNCFQTARGSNTFLYVRKLNGPSGIHAYGLKNIMRNIFLVLCIVYFFVGVSWLNGIIAFFALKLEYLEVKYQMHTVQMCYFCPHL